MEKEGVLVEKTKEELSKEIDELERQRAEVLSIYLYIYIIYLYLYLYICALCVYFEKQCV